MSYKFPVPDGWAASDLQDFCTKVADGTHDSPKRTEIGKLLVTSKNIVGGTLDLSKSYRISEDDFNEVNRRSKVDVNDVLLSMIGTVGEACLVENEPDFAIKNVGLLKNDDPLKARWLYFYLRSPQAQSLIKERLRGTTQQYLPLGEIRKFPIIFPQSRVVLQGVVDVLGRLNDKIQLNHQINQTLEQMAQAIFKSWFVDFEPVKAKIAALDAGGTEEDALLAAMQVISGKDADQLTQMQAEQPERYAELRATAKLFPSAMQDSELGDIPEGWACLALDTVAKYQNGLALQKFRPENDHEYLPVVKIAQLKKGYADGIEKASPNIKPDCIIGDGDVVFSWSGSLMVDTWCGGKAALNQHLFKVTSKSYPKWLYYYFTKHHLDEFQRIAAAKAVTMGHIKREHLKAALCAVPCEELIKVGTMVIGSLIDKQIEGRLESKNLAQLRDTLLPKLLSGELVLPDTEDAQTELQDVAHV